MIKGTARHKKESVRMPTLCCIPVNTLMTLTLFSFITAASAPYPGHCEDSPHPFYPTWKLLSPAEKQQFVAGYIQGWKDAERVTDVAISYVKENPGKAVDGLERIRSLYDLGDLRPALLASAIDEFYRDPDNLNGGLSQAVSAAKRAVSGR